MVRRVVGRHYTIKLTDSDVQAAFDLLESPEGLTAKASSFTRQEALKALGDQLITTSPRQLRMLTDRFLAERAVAVVTDTEHRAGRRWSTRELLATEQHMVAAAQTRAGEGCAIVDPLIVAEALERSARSGTRLGPDQEAMVRGVLSDGQGVFVVVGRAGSGKTTAADAARYGFERAGYEPLGLAPTGAAVRVLNRDTGMMSLTVDSFLDQLTRGEATLSDRTVLVCDEAAMVATRKLQPLLERARRAGAKVVLIGDHKQLQPIDAGGGFRALQLRLGAYELTQNRRQRHLLDQQAVELIRDSRGDEALALYDDHGRVHVAETLAECDQAMVGAWWQAYGRQAGTRRCSTTAASTSPG